MADSDSTPGKSPAFQFYPKDFVTGTLTLTTEEVGAYMLLLCHAWDKGSIPSDIKMLARIARLSPGRMRLAWAVLSAKFTPTDGGYIQPRLEREREKQAQFRQRQTDAAQKRWDKRGNATASERHIPEPSQPDALLSPISYLQSPDSSRAPIGALARTRRDAGLMEGSKPSQHGDCLVHGPVCFRPQFAAKYIGRFGQDRAAMVAWAREVCDDWQERVDRGERVPEGNDFAFWDARYTEHHTKQTPSEGALASNLRKSTMEFLKS